MNYLGLDYGRARIGLAIGDSQTRLAVPLKTVANLDEVVEIIKKENIKAVVIGNPLTLAGEAGKMSEAVKEFSRRLLEQVKVKIIMVDERLTTQAGQNLPSFSQPKKTRKKKKKIDKDAIAAMLILQSYFDREKISPG